MFDIESAIRQRAYEFWQADGEMTGHELEHWLKAEAEIKGLLAPEKKLSRAAARKPATKPATRAKAKA